MISYPDGAADNLRWEQFRARPGDIIISTPPKAGTTLTQMLCALLVFDGPEFPGPLDGFSPWFDQITRGTDEALALVEAQTHRRILKTHTPLDGIPTFDEATYISVHRDPRDVFVSWIHHAANIDIERFKAAVADAGYLDRLLANRQNQPETWDERFQLWLDLPWQHSVFALERIVRHAAVAEARREAANVEILHFADLHTDLVGSLATIATAIGVDCRSDRLEALAPHAGLDQMRVRASDLAPVTKGQLRDPAHFFRSGSGGEWRDLVSTELLSVYGERMINLASPELRAWLERS